MLVASGTGKANIVCRSIAELVFTLGAQVCVDDFKVQSYAVILAISGFS